MEDIKFVKHLAYASWWSRVQNALETPGRHSLVARYRESYFDEGEWASLYVVRVRPFCWLRITFDASTTEYTRLTGFRLTKRGAVKATLRKMRNHVRWGGREIEVPEEHTWAM